MQEFFLPRDLKQVMNMYTYKNNFSFLGVDVGSRKIGLAMNIGDFIYPISTDKFLRDVLRRDTLKIDGLVIGLSKKLKSQNLLKDFLTNLLNENEIKTNKIYYMNEEFTTKSVYKDVGCNYPATSEDSKVALLLLTTFLEILSKNSALFSSNLN